MGRISVNAIVFLFAISFLSHASLHAQGKRKGSREVRKYKNCEYEVLKGLAEITRLEVVTEASESLLGYDEYDLQFKFIPKTGGELMSSLRTDLDFFLKSGNTTLPVGPKYIKSYHIRKGTKYAMTLLQNRTGAKGCPDEYKIESKALPNDVFEPTDENLFEYKKIAAADAYKAREAKRNQRKQDELDAQEAQEVERLRQEEEAKKKAKDQTTADETPEEEPVAALDDFDIPGAENMTPEELAKAYEEQLRKRMEEGGDLNIAGGNNLDVDVDELQKEIEEEVRKKYKVENLYANKNTDKKDKNDTKKREQDAIRKAKLDAKRKAKEKKEAEKRKREEEKRKAEELAALKEKLRKEAEAKIKAELAKEAAERKAAESAARKAKEEDAKKQEELKERQNQIKQEVLKRMQEEMKRKECVFNDRVSGTIQVVNVAKYKEKAVSALGYTEYVVQVRFRPDNYNELSKKERKVWDVNHTFTLEPKGRNANPSAAYIRKYLVSKGSKYKGFAQVLKTGVCNPVMMFSPTLPNDSSQIKLK